MRVEVEQFGSVGSKGINEDTFVIVDRMVGVFDGASPLIQPEVPSNRSLSGGQIASQTARQIFKENPDRPLKDSALMANQAVRDAQNLQPFDSGKAWSTTISAVRIDKTHLESLSIGDSPIITIDSFNQVTQIGGTYDWDVESLELWQHLVAEGVPNPRQDPRMKEQLLRVRRAANVEYGYCNGDPKMQNFIDINYQKLPLDGLKAVIAMTDGFMLPKTSPRGPEKWWEFEEIFAAAGLETVLANIRRLEAIDYNCKKYPRFKRSDDATAIALKFNNP